MSAIGDIWPDEDRRDDALERIAAVIKYSDDLLPTAYAKRAAKDQLREDERFRVLTPAETRALQAASFGMRNSDIAELYGLSQLSVADQLKAARRRLKAKNTTHACCMALREGLIQ